MFDVYIQTYIIELAHGLGGVQEKRATIELKLNSLACLGIFVHVKVQYEVSRDASWSIEQCFKVDSRVELSMHYKSYRSIE